MTSVMGQLEDVGLLDLVLWRSQKPLYVSAGPQFHQIAQVSVSPGSQNKFCIDTVLWYSHIGSPWY